MVADGLPKVFKDKRMIQKARLFAGTKQLLAETQPNHKPLPGPPQGRALKN